MTAVAPARLFGPRIGRGLRIAPRPVACLRCRRPTTLRLDRDLGLCRLCQPEERKGLARVEGRA